MNTAQIALGLSFIKMYLRDRQSLFFGLFMPFLLLALLGSIYGDGGGNSFGVGIVDNAHSALSERFITSLREVSGFNVTLGDEAALKDKIVSGELVLVLVIPKEFSSPDKGVELSVTYDGGKLTLAGMAMQSLQQTLVEVERGLRGSVPMFTLNAQNIQSHNTRYIDFLLPGILAMSVMQISIAGSAFNSVEYRRRGILKRLFVTPIHAMDFVGAMCASRLLLAVIQVTVLMGIGVFILDAHIGGSMVLFFGVVVLGTVIFLCMGFAVGGISRTQDSVTVIGNLIILPQMFLSGIFFPIEAMPDWLQPAVSLLPLSFVVGAMREIAVNDAGIFDILPSLAGITVWILICFVLATRLFEWRDFSQQLR
jgi:ABC-2 type transport system permease protein